MDTYDWVAMLSAEDMHEPYFDIRQLDNPEWDKGDRVHNWHNHVPNTVMELWPRINDAGRFSIYLIAQGQANNEDWGRRR